MTKFNYKIIFCLLIFLQGCVISLYSLFTDKDLFFEPKLIGTWVDKDGNDTWIFQQSDKNKYTILNYQIKFERPFDKNFTSGDTVSFEGRLGKIGEYLFLDLRPEENPVKNNFFNLHLFPVHTISRIWINGDSIRVALFDHNWLKKMIDNNAIAISHQRVGEQILLTASVSDLQKLITKFADDEDAFPPTRVYYRMK